MTSDQAIVFSIIGCAMVMFIWGRWRYDLVAVIALLAAIFTGVVPPGEAFHGLGHPAVITVAAVLVISRALQVSGVVNHLVRMLAPTRKNPALQITTTTTLTAALSAIMNNVGALALMLPVSIRNAYRAKRSPSLILMPLSFASLLGGLITLIGTPPNIVIASARQEFAGAPFKMFDFTYVGLVVAAAGLLYLTTIGWRLLPERLVGQDGADGLFHVEAYTTEARVSAGSPLIGKQVRQLEQLCENDITVMAIVRGNRRMLAPSGIEHLQENDILLLEGDPAVLEPLTDGVSLDPLGHKAWPARDLRSEDVRVVEAVLMPNAPIEGQSMRGVKLHDRYGINLLAIARQGQAPRTRLTRIKFKTGDVLLLQGERNTLYQSIRDLGCLVLADRGFAAPRRRRTIVPAGVFGAAIAAAALGLVSVPVAFVTAVALLVIIGTISLQEVYDSIEWPIIVLLAALIPIGHAMFTTGGTGLIASALTGFSTEVPIWAILALLVLSCMWLSDLIHNTPTAVLMAPVAATMAKTLDLPVDPFLMAVAIGSASPYLTPIGHQSNTLVMGPGGYRFSDYTRLGLPMELIILAVSVPMIMWVWMP